MQGFKSGASLRKQEVSFTIKHCAWWSPDFKQCLQNKILHKNWLLTKVGHQGSLVVVGGVLSSLLAAFSTTRWIYLRKLKICSVNVNVKWCNLAHDEGEIDTASSKCCIDINYSQKSQWTWMQWFKNQEPPWETGGDFHNKNILQQ